MKKLQTKQLDNWELKHFEFLVTMYRKSTEQKLKNIFDKRDKRRIRRDLIERQKSKDSIMNPMRITKSLMIRRTQNLLFRKTIEAEKQQMASCICKKKRGNSSD